MENVVFPQENRGFNPTQPTHPPPQLDPKPNESAEAVIRLWSLKRWSKMIGQVTNQRSRRISIGGMIPPHEKPGGSVRMVCEKFWGAT